MEWVLLWLLCAIVAAVLGARRGRAGFGFLLGAVFGPIGVLLAAINKGDRVNCSHCREMIHPEAIVCPHCQREVIPARGTIDRRDGWIPTVEKPELDVPRPRQSSVERK